VTNRVNRVHADTHALWLDPKDSNHVILGCDGGIYSSHDRGKTWVHHDNIALGQFYEVGLDNSRPYRLCGGLQDNNAWCGPSATLDNRGILNSDWVTVGGGDGFYAKIDPTDPNIVYAESQDGNVLRRNMKTHESRSIRPLPPEGEFYRFQWNSPIVISAYDNKTIYYGGNYLFKSTNRGDDWVRLGGDLTNNEDRNKMPIMGKVTDEHTLSRFDGVQNWPAITVVAESPLNKDVLWAGTDDGNLQVTRDGGKAWKNVFDNVKGVPKGTYVNRIEASRFAEGTAYAAFDGHRSGDFNIYLYMTTDFGANWKAIRNGLPEGNDIVHVVREHHRNGKLLFAGTEHGLFVSFDQGANWEKLKLNLPTTRVDDIQIHPRENDMVLATHGRSFWILDDITPLEQMSDATAAEDLHVFSARNATEWRVANKGTLEGNLYFVGPNPPNGAIIQYTLKSKMDEKDRVRFTITDKDGKTVRAMDGTKEVGLNRVTWDLRANSPIPPVTDTAATGAPGAEGPPGGGFGGFFGGGGSRVEPGEYTVKVVAGKSEQSIKVTVEEDPRVEISAADRAARRDALNQLAPLVGQATTSQRSITGLRTALNTVVEGWKRPGPGKPSENVQKAAEDLLKKATEVCKKLAAGAQCGERGEALGNAGPPLVQTATPVPQRLQQLMGGIENFMSAPTATQLEQMKIVMALANDAVPAARKLTTEDLPALNKMMNEAGVPHIVVPTAGGGGRPGGPPPDDDGDDDIN